MATVATEKLKEIALRIKELREIVGLDTREMARKTEVTEEEYARYERKCEGELDAYGALLDDERPLAAGDHLELRRYERRVDVGPLDGAAVGAEVVVLLGDASAFGTDVHQTPPRILMW